MDIKYQNSDMLAALSFKPRQIKCVLLVVKMTGTPEGLAVLA